jgi:hypothetical protein
MAEFVSKRTGNLSVSNVIKIRLERVTEKLVTSKIERYFPVQGFVHECKCKYHQLIPLCYVSDIILDIIKIF